MIDNELLQNKPVFSKPYGNPIFAEVIKDVLLAGRKRFILSHTNRFRTNYGGTISYVMPGALVALVATAVSVMFALDSLSILTFALQVEAALKDYCTGFAHTSEFLAEVYGGVYKTHMKVLDEEKSEQPLPFHLTMSKLFQDTMYVSPFLIQVLITNIETLQWL